MQEFYQKIKEEIEKKDLDVDEIVKFRNSLLKKHRLKQIPSITQILLNADINIERIKKLQIKPVRTISGVAPVAIMTEPRKCPHGTCTFCPGGPESFFGSVPQSYTGNEPASMRAARNKFDAYLQVMNRLEQYILLGHDPEKVELIIMGGTFPDYPAEYRERFIRDALKAMNDFSEMFHKEDFDFKSFKKFFELPGEMRSLERSERIHEKLLKLKGESSLEEEQNRNEKARVRCVVFNVETKPDICKEKDINEMLKLGVTRVELGVQVLDDAALKKVNRGHTLNESITATKLLKDSFLKTCYHMMPGLPGRTKEDDVNDLRAIFEDENYMPDALKVYPCMVMPGTPLYEQYKRGEFKPLTTEEAAEIIVEAKKYFPKWTRVMRIQRDIPTKVTIDGVDITNFRQYAHELMKKKGIKCRCIRCREPGKDAEYDNVKLLREDYDSSKGKEVFLSFEDVKKDKIIGFTRLRMPNDSFREEIDNKTAGIREIHVYGTALPLGIKGKVQHKGYGRRLMEEAEKIAKEEFDMKKMLVISGIGVREYFKNKLNYRREGSYMGKKL